ncbi:substrate-binding domain-containing protein [Carboxylicivirga sp. N1Y90]|uniref:substrate-binding domain-containing protein n=1 Tax=Carboxylicivirga fragile TaxID=3417571 RepID=UPI003D32C59D|nr:substrate-binding domain-containing protein [Marinilabiliaceae bacterium N1Y90]
MPLLKRLTLLIICCSLALASCKHKAHEQSNNEDTNKKELLIYCENSMVGLVLDLKTEFENTHNCKIRVQNDCSKNLMGLIRYSQKGDLYIPASTYSFQNFRTETGFTLTDSIFVGYNDLVFMVKKNNPKGFIGDLKALKSDDKIAYIIADPETSSIGYETKKMLKSEKVYDRVLNNVVALSSDSKGLIKSVRNNKADVVIDWASNLNVNGNSKEVDKIIPNTEFNRLIPVYAASLSCSSEPELTRSFLKFTNAQLNESKLSKYGFTKRKKIIF